MTENNHAQFLIMWAVVDSTEGKIRIPVEHWIICLPTKHCVEGKTVYTYWQAIKSQAESEDKE